MTQRPEPDLTSCPDCKHPVAVHATGGVCGGWQDVSVHPCDGVPDTQLEQHRDQQSTPHRGNPLDLVLFDEPAPSPGWMPDPDCGHPNHGAAGHECEPLTGTLAYAGALLDDDTIAELSETVGGDDALALWRRANPAIPGRVVLPPGPVTAADVERVVGPYPVAVDPGTVHLAGDDDPAFTDCCHRPFLELGAHDRLTSNVRIVTCDVTTRPAHG